MGARRRIVSFAMLFLAAAGCGRSGAPEQQPAAVSDALGVPVTYTGTIPCADCPGIQLTITLLADSTYRLRQVYLERPSVFHDMGRWTLERNGPRLVLRGAGDSPGLFEVVGGDSLRMLDAEGRPIQSGLNYSLARAPSVDPVRDTMRLRGMYSYMADAGRFTECASGSTFPVAMVAANAALERAYSDAVAEPGAPLLVTFTGHIEQRTGMEGDRRIEHVVVDSMGSVLPDATCQNR